MGRSARFAPYAFAAATLGALAVVVACTGDDDVFRAAPTYAYDASTTELPGLPAATTDAAPPPLTCGDAGGAPARLLVVNGQRPSELAAVNLGSLAVDGRLSLDGGLGVTSASGLDPWLIDQERDIVSRLDAREPWKAVGQWNVHGDDALGSDTSPAKPISVAQVSCTKAYVLRANRNRIAIIDPSQSTGVPTGWVDFAPFAYPGDTGTLDLVSALWVPSKRKVFVLAGNVDQSAGKRCSDRLRSALFAIDVASDKVVSLAGKGNGGSIQLEGYDPPIGSSLVYDAQFDRLLVISNGCTVTQIDGGTALVRRRIEQVDLATGAVKLLLSLNDRPAPTGLAIVDGDNAAVVFGEQGFVWNPREPSLGAPIDGGAHILANDGRGAFIGARTRDTGLELFALPLGDGGATQPLTSNPFTTTGGTAASLEPWPRR